jgi:hypothetical protein
MVLFSSARDNHVVAEAQGHVGYQFSRLSDEASHILGLVSVHTRPWGIPSGVCPKFLATESTSAHSATEIVIEAMIKGLRPGPTAQYFARKPPRLWRSCFRKWMSTSELIMTSDKEGRKLIDFLRWLGASEGGSTLGMSDQSTAPVRMMTKEASFRGHSTRHSLRGSSKAPSGHQLQGAEAIGALDEDMGISPGKSIACSVVRTRVTLQEPARSLFWSKKRLPKPKLGRISRSRFYILLRATLLTYQNMWAINLQLLLLRQAIHRLLGLSSHHHHLNCNLLIPEASSQKGASTPNNNVTLGRSLKLVQSIVLY